MILETIFAKRYAPIAPSYEDELRVTVIGTPVAKCEPCLLVRQVPATKGLLERIKFVGLV